MVANPKYPPIEEPTVDPASLRQTALSTKQTVEILTGQRGNRMDSAVTWGELVALGIIAADQVPR